ncbi:MAG: D-tyrosyl-tRNA(Tyr) deacylase [Victivallales bacterium]|jgi:D-tyrosyl-tRNA(Tyr) deacylase|nr:D-tyrosyl-tRNA(Tyr) deacylase [Victivallales bacterium]
MRALIQRASSGRVEVAEEQVGEIGHGLVILLGITHNDTEKDAAFVADKCMNLRIFEDDAGKMNRSLLDIKGEALVISQFTLYGDASHGRRPSFTAAARPEIAEALYEKFISYCRGYDVKVATGKFGADMKLALVNDGPVTILVESR